MCGICGVVTRPDGARRIERQAVVRMRDVMTHRGPDGAGLHLAPGVALGHRRLSIIDVEHGAQPMASADERFHIVYNGEVFNHPSLKAELEQAGVAFRTRCDTETVLHLYERLGGAAVERLRGMFAIAIWDEARRELFLARDRFGVKPLYYHLADDGTLFFASEIKALLAAGAVAPRLNVGALPDFLANHATSGDETLFAGIRRLAPGHTLRWRDGAIELRRYWDLADVAEGTATGTPAQLVDEYHERLREAVRLRLMSDVPLGVFLSGGIDSAAITALMAGMVDERVNSFSVAFAEREANELSYARLVAERYRTHHREVVVSPADFFGAVPKLVWHEDEPMAHPSSVPLHFVSKLAAEHVKVVLTGEGSDEMLAGYNRYRVTVFNRRFGQAYERLVPGPLRGAVRSAVQALPATSTLGRRLGRTFLGRAADLDTLYFDNFAVFPRDRQSALLAPGLRASLAGVDPYAAAHAAIARVAGATPLTQLLYADTRTYLHELLMKQDQMSMSASIESRVPFLDHPLAEFSTSLPERLKLDGVTTKAVLRRAMKDLLPPEILSRKKMGFPVPVGAWLRGPYTHLLDDVVLGERAMARGLFAPDAVRALVAGHRRGEGGHQERLWMLLNLEIWQRIFLDGEAVEDVVLDRAGATAVGVA